MSYLFKHLRITHPESYTDSKQKQEDAQISKSPAPPSGFRVFREATHIQVAPLFIISLLLPEETPVQTQNIS